MFAYTQRELKTGRTVNENENVNVKEYVNEYGNVYDAGGWG